MLGKLEKEEMGWKAGFWLGIADSERNKVVHFARGSSSSWRGEIVSSKIKENLA